MDRREIKLSVLLHAIKQIQKKHYELDLFNTAYMNEYTYIWTNTFVTEFMHQI